MPFRLQVNSLSVSHLVKHLIFYTGGDVEPRRHATARGVLHPASVQAEGRGPEAQTRSGEVEQEAGLGEGEVLAPVRHHHPHVFLFPCVSMIFPRYDCTMLTDLSVDSIYTPPSRGISPAQVSRFVNNLQAK